MGTVSEHVVPVLDGHPDQALNVCPVLGAAMSAIVLPTVNCAPHTPPAPEPQAIPVGTLVTVPSVEVGNTLTVTTACVVLPPGQSTRVRSLTVTVAKFVT